MKPAAIKQRLMFDKQTGQSMTQYLILMFVMTLGSLTAFGQFGQKGQHQIAMVAGEIAGKAGSSYSSSSPTDTGNTGSQSNSPYSGAGTTTGSNNPSVPNDTSSGNVVTQPGTNGPNTTPAVPNNSPPEVVTGNPVTDRTGQNNSQNTDNQATENTDTTDTKIPTGQTDLGAGTTTTETEPPPLCTKEGSTEETPEITEDKSQVKEEDKGIFGSLWDDFKAVVKDTVIAGYEFIKGFWEGMKAQIADLANLLTNPKEVVMGLIELGKQFVKEPAKTAKMIADSLGDEFKTLALCGAYDKGRVIGSNISPAFMVKFATKMASFGGDVKRALNSTKKDFGCASFAAGTPIWTTDGKVNIETLVKGNTVLSRARLTYQDKPQTIEKTFGRTAKHYYQLTTEFETIKVTEEHPIWKQGRGWTEVQYLKVDDVVASADGDVLILDNKKIDKPIEVYNFSVENTPSYFAGVGKLWVHNAKCGAGKLTHGNSYRKTAKGNINYPEDWIAHHLIPVKQAKNSVVMKAAADLAGYNINRKTNLLMLPKNAEAAAKSFNGKPANASKLPDHRGGHNQGGEVGKNYQNHVRDKLNKLDQEYLRDKKQGKPWSQEKLLGKLKELEDEIKSDLLKGKSPPLCSTCKSGAL